MLQPADKTIKWFVDSEGEVVGSEAWAGDLLFNYTAFDTPREAREEALRRTSDLRDKYANLATTHARWILDDNKRLEEEKRKSIKVGDRVRDKFDLDKGTVIAISERAKEIIVEIDDENPWTYSYTLGGDSLEKIED